MKKLFKSKSGKSTIIAIFLTAIITAILIAGAILWYGQKNSLDSTVQGTQKDVNKMLTDFENNLNTIQEDLNEELDVLRKDIENLRENAKQMINEGEEELQKLINEPYHDIVKDFYDEWIDANDSYLNRANAMEGEFITTDLLSKIKDKIDSSEENYDPVTCSAEKATEFRVVDADKFGQYSTVMIELEFSQGLTKVLKIDLIKRNEKWLISNIICPDDAKEDVYIYLYNQQEDEEINGYVACTSDAVLPVKREIVISNNPIIDTLRMLLTGQLSEEEVASGYSTEYPGDNFILIDSNLEDGVLTLTFEDPDNFTSGGSCRVSLLKSQIEKTVMQFDNVDRVEFKPDTLFQP